MSLSLKARVISLLLFESKTITLILACVGLILGVGFLFADSTSSDYYALKLLANSTSWAIIFILYALIKFWQVLFDGISGRLKVAVSSIGVWLWSYLFFAFVTIDSANITPAELLLIIPLLCEIVELIIDLFQCKHSGSRETSR